MTLFLCAQDLEWFWLGLIRDESFFVLERVTAPPERYLSELHRFLHAHGWKPEDLAGVSVVRGPGSFTASRVSLTLANTLHFAFRIPLHILANPDSLAPAELLARHGVGEQLSVGTFAAPFYSGPARITVPKAGDKALDTAGI
ncbi:hypothetical protein FJZ23_00610 [Candidatus Parcubacteria bacterium]|nr:hypothetical protein [Candidatus Parcubacteria bacterium]